MKRTLLKSFLYSSFILLTLGLVACSSGSSYKDDATDTTTTTTDPNR